ncbi:transmembrane segment-containing protein [Variovorax phage VarioGold]|uniref:hypothetical protein n=1 Tax=Variovorax sp. ZS18.2.2 TaxID=2971255 RepID=UPI0021517CA4|nr:hypothetical protein [Variovorax sp. ZS18.2.2]MCR6477517.1 hypothetical protein [Variovorax sp. ZS18.2.2]UYD72068.1 transmembrane segment-containing protein [Variovorax phage VarioGold]
MQNIFKRLGTGIVQSFLGTAMLVRVDVDELRRYIASAPSWPVDQDRAEVRLQAAFITTVFLLLLAEPIFYVFGVPDSFIGRVSSMTYSRWCVIGAFSISFAAALPHLYTLVFRPDLLDHKGYRRAAAFAAVLAGATWIVLANRAVQLDVGGLAWAYAIRAVSVFFIAGIFGVSVNAQQMREHFHAAPR